VRFGELGVSINDPDVFALDVRNNMLNGFGGRLINEVRIRTPCTQSQLDSLTFCTFGREGVRLPNLLYLLRSAIMCVLLFTSSGGPPFAIRVYSNPI
jgi:hypothetical protein